MPDHPGQGDKVSTCHSSLLRWWWQHRPCLLSYWESRNLKKGKGYPSNAQIQQGLESERGRERTQGKLEVWFGQAVNTSGESEAWTENQEHFLNLSKVISLLWKPANTHILNFVCIIAFLHLCLYTHTGVLGLQRLNCPTERASQWLARRVPDFVPLQFNFKNFSLSYLSWSNLESQELQDWTISFFMTRGLVKQ